MSKKDDAYQLFSMGWSQKRIAEALKTSEQNITRWKKDGKWEKSIQQNEDNLRLFEQDIWTLLRYESSVLNAEVEHNLSLLESNDPELKKELHQLPTLDKGSVDTLSKLYKQVRQEDVKWAEVVSVISSFIGFVSQADNELAKKIIPLSDVFINEKRGTDE